MANNHQTVKEILKFLEDGEKKVTLSGHKDIILVLGNTGSVETSQSKRGSFVIVGDERILDGTTSKTIYPEMALGNGNVYYDCPGFDDTRGVENDISGIYFVKKVIEHSKRLKIILTIDDSLFFDSRTEFPKLIEHISSFIRDISKFENSILLIFTKVDTGTQTVKEYKNEILDALIKDDLENLYIKKLRNIYEHIGKLTTHKEFVQMIIDEMDKLQIELHITSEKRITAIMNDGSYFDFLKTVKSEITTTPGKWIRGFDNLIRTKLSITCISPRWKIHNKCEIGLDGVSGSSHSPLKANNGKDNTDNRLSLQGEIGKPGLPGGNAGNFLGVYKEINNRNGLIITADGGKGGPGQNGGDGGNGKDGDDFKVDNVRNQRYQKETLDPFPNTRSGRGGYNGYIELINTQNRQELTDLTSRKPENVGDRGIGGKGGSGGKKGNGEEVKYHEETGMFKTDFYWTKIQDLPTNTRAISGKDGIDNKNDQTICLPEKRFERCNFAIDVNNYKKFLRSNLDNPFKVELLTRFIQEIEFHPKIHSTYNTIGLFGDMEILENNFYDLVDRKINILPFYESFLERITKYTTETNKQYYSAYAQSEFTSTHNKSYKKALEYLYTNLLSKTWSLKSTQAPFLIVDINKYFKIVTESIELLKEKEEQIAIIKYQNEFKKNIDGPVGAGISAAAGGAIMISETFILDDNTSDMKPISLPSGIKTSYQELAKRFNDKYANEAKIFKQQLEVVEKEIENYKEFEDINGEIKRIKDEIKLIEDAEPNPTPDNNSNEPSTSNDNLIEPNTSSKDKIDKLKKELKDVLKNKKNSLKEEESHANQKNKDILKKVEYVNNLIRIAELGVDLYSKLQIDKQKLNVINDNVKELDNDFNRLKDYEDGIYKIIKPILQEIKDDIIKVEKNEGKSHASLDFSKWLIQSKIRDINNQLKQATKEFKAQYIANIRSPTIDSIYIQDYALKEATIRVEKAIQLNIVLGQYNNAINAFKQWVFPFGFLYHQEYKLPDSMALTKNNNTLKNIKMDAIKQIETISTKIREYYVTVTEYDIYVNEGEFYNSASMNPFTIWENKLYQDEISSMFKGEIVTLNADIAKSDPEKSAIKFNKIGNSNYRWNNQNVIIRSREQVISYHFEKRTDGELVNSSKAYQKITKGDFILSPYAMWEIQLFVKKNADFSVLHRYKNKVNLELVGHGKWINETNIPPNSPYFN
ncbi:15529_t:CDS:2, partial [Dentiscutata erythropus]